MQRACRSLRRGGVRGAEREMCACYLQVLYNAQMIRTFSLLLRSAQRLGYIVNGRQVGPPPPAFAQISGFGLATRVHTLQSKKK